MKNKKAGVLLSAVATTAVCASLIAGSTYALFTSEDAVDITVKTGNVAVSATIDNPLVETPSAIDHETGVVVEGATYSKSAEATAMFTSTEEGKFLTVTNVLPGDRVTYDLVVKNEGNVSARFNYELDCTEGYELMSQFEISVKNGETALLTKEANVKKYASAWDTIAAGQTVTYNVTMELPSTVGNAYKGLTTKVSALVHAIQTNANVSGEAVVEYIVSDDEALMAAFENGGSFALTKNASLMGAVNLTGNSVVSLDLNGKELTVDGKVQKNGSPIVARGNSSLTLSNGTIKPVLDGNRTAQATINQCDTSSITLNKITIEPMKYGMAGYGVNTEGNGTIAINNSTIKSGCAVATNAKKPIAPTVIINDSVLDGYATGILFNVAGTLTVKNSTISGINQGVLLRAGTATFTNCTICTTLVDPRSGAQIEITEDSASNTFNPFYTTTNWGTGTNQIPLAALVIGCTKPNSGYDSNASATLINTKVDESNDFIEAKKVGLIHHAILAWNYYGEGNGTANVTIDDASMAKLNGTVCEVVGTAYSYNG